MMGKTYVFHFYLSMSLHLRNNNEKISHKKTPFSYAFHKFDKIIPIIFSCIDTKKQTESIRKLKQKRDVFFCNCIFNWCFLHFFFSSNPKIFQCKIKLPNQWKQQSMKYKKTAYSERDSIRNKFICSGYYSSFASILFINISLPTNRIHATLKCI